jgi:hypothetical protein
MGGVGYRNWSFTPYFAISLAPRPSDAEVNTSYLVGRRNHNTDNPCDHAKWEGHIDFSSSIGPWEDNQFHGAFGFSGYYWISWPRGHFFKILYPGDRYFTVCGANWQEPGNIFCYVEATGGYDFMYGNGTIEEGLFSGNQTKCEFAYRNDYGSYVFKRYAEVIVNDQLVSRTYMDEWATNEVYCQAFPNGWKHHVAEIEARFRSWAQPRYTRWLDPISDPDAAFYAGNASQAATNGFNSVESNMITNVMELPELGQSGIQIAKSLKDPSVRAAANAWLAYRYGDRLTYQDAKQLISAVQSHIDVLSPNMIRSSKGRSVHEKTLGDYPQKVIYNCTIRVRNGSSDVISAVERADQLGSLPTTARLWDAVPYSFIVDWFINVADCCSIIDTWFKQGRLDIVGCVESTKGTVTVPSKRLVPSTFGQVDLVRYVRRPVSKPAMPIMDLDHLVTTPSWKNYLDGAAIIIGGSQNNRSSCMQNYCFFYH